MAHIRQSRPDSGLGFQVNVSRCSLFAWQGHGAVDAPGDHAHVERVAVSPSTLIAAGISEEFDLRDLLLHQDKGLRTNFIVIQGWRGKHVKKEKHPCCYELQDHTMAGHK